MLKKKDDGRDEEDEEGQLVRKGGKGLQWLGPLRQQQRGPHLGVFKQYLCGQSGSTWDGLTCQNDLEDPESRTLTINEQSTTDGFNLGP